MAKMMKAARMHDVGQPMAIEELPIPEVRPTDVLVKVAACGIVPNLGNVLANWTKWFTHLPLPKLPAIFGLDATGVIEAVGSQVHAWKPGDRVYVNPARYCGGCRACQQEIRLLVRTTRSMGTSGSANARRKCLTTTLMAACAST